MPHYQLTKGKGSNNQIKFVMFNINNGVKYHSFDLVAISDQHAVAVAQDLYNRLGLIGRYYCETSSGYCFQIN